MSAVERTLDEMRKQHRWTITVYSDDIFQPVYEDLYGWLEPDRGYKKWKNGILNNLERRKEIKRKEDWWSKDNRKVRKLWLKPAYRGL